MVLTDKFTYENSEFEPILNNLKLTNAEITVYNVAINQKLHDFVLQEFKRKLPLVFINGKLT